MGQWCSVRFGCERVQDRIHVTSVNYNYYYFFVNEGYMKRKYPRRCTFLCMHITSRQQVDWSSAYGFVCDRCLPSSILSRGVKSPPSRRVCMHYTVLWGWGCKNDRSETCYVRTDMASLVYVSDAFY